MRPMPSASVVISGVRSPPGMSVHPLRGRDAVGDTIRIVVARADRSRYRGGQREPMRCRGGATHLGQPIDLLEQQLPLSVNVADQHEGRRIVDVAQDLGKNLSAGTSTAEVADPRLPA